MRILGWLLLVGGLLLCVSILWAAPGFFCMGVGLIFLQIAEQKRRRAKSAASPSDQSEPQVEPAPVPEATRALVPPIVDEDAGAGPESATGLHSYDKQRWRALLSSDADISRLAKTMESYGQKYVDEFAAAYLALNDKDYLPMILRKIIASARRDSGQNIAGDFPDENTNPDAVAIAFSRTRRIDRVREMRSGYAEKSASVDNAPKIDAGPEKQRASEPSGPKSSDPVDVSAVRTTAAEETNREPVAADVESKVSEPRQITVEATSPKPPGVPDAAVGRDEKKRTREVVDADNLTEILDRLSQALTPKTE
jgi:hypothetical protein